MSDQENHDGVEKSSSNVIVLPVPAADESGRKKKAVIHATIVDAMMRRPLKPNWFPFEHKLHKWIDDSGSILIYHENDNGIVRLVNNDYVDSLICRYWESMRHTGVVTADDVTKTRRLWRMQAPARTEPFPLLTWKSDPRPAFHKMPFNPLPLSQCKAPVCEELMNRTTNAGAFMAWVGSIFDEQSQLQQYVWMYGAGGNGKGTFVRCLMTYLGNVAKADNAPPGRQPDKFWTSGMMGKRLCVFPDCDEPGFVTTGLFKSLTGEDHIRVEIKGGSILSLRLPLKFFFTSNEKPLLTGAKSDMRRVIYCSVTIPETPLENYEERMMAEMPAFLSACWHAYQAATGGNPRAVIQADDGGAELEDIVSDAEHDYETFVCDWLDFATDEHGMIVPDPNLKAPPPLTCADMAEAMTRAGFREERDRRKLRAYLARKHGIKATQAKVNGVNRKSFLHIVLKRDSPKLSRFSVAKQDTQDTQDTRFPQQ